MANSTSVTSLSDRPTMPNPGRGADRARALARWCLDEGRADLRALARCTRSLARRLLRQRHKTRSAQDLASARAELGRLAVDAGIEADLPSLPIVVERRRSAAAVNAALEQARDGLRLHREEFAARKQEATATTARLRDEAARRRQAVAAAESAAGPAAGAGAAAKSSTDRSAREPSDVADPRASAIHLASLRLDADEAADILHAQENEWAAEAARLERVVAEDADAVAKLEAEHRAASTALADAHRELGWEIQFSGVTTPEITEPLARVKALAESVEQDESQLRHLSAEIRSDRRRAIRAAIVLAALLSLIGFAMSSLLSGGVGQNSRSPSNTGSSGANPSGANRPGVDSSGADFTGTSGTAQSSPGTGSPTRPGHGAPASPPAPAPRRSSSETSAPWPSPALRDALLAHPALAGVAGQSDRRPTGVFTLVSRIPLRDGTERQEILAEIERRAAGGAPLVRSSVRLSVVVDAAEHVLEARIAGAAGPEDDELFRLLEERR